MRSLSSEARGLLEQLHHNPRADHAHCLRRLGELAEPACVNSLLPLVLDSAWAQAVTQCLRATLENLDPAALPRWDRRWRHYPQIGGQETLKWWGLQPRELLSLARIIEGDWVVAAACSHHHGYVREMAVRRLAQSDGAGWKLGYLLLRCKDWVTPVRAAALAAVRQRVIESSPEILTNHLVLLEWLGDPELLSQCWNLLERAQALNHGRAATASASAAKSGHLACE